MIYQIQFRCKSLCGIREMGRQAADLNVKYYINLCCMIVRNPHSTDFYPLQQQQKKTGQQKIPALIRRWTDRGFKAYYFVVLRTTKNPYVNATDAELDQEVFVSAILPSRTWTETLWQTEIYIFPFYLMR